MTVRRLLAPLSFLALLHSSTASCQEMTDPHRLCNEKGDRTFPATKKCEEFYDTERSCPLFRCKADPHHPHPAVAEACHTDCCAPQRPRWWFRGEYLLWWLDAADLPPIVTTGTIDPTNPFDRPGQLGQPDTRVLLGGDSFGANPFSGGRFTAGGWLDAERLIGVEASYLFLAERAETATLSAPGTPGSTPLLLPFVNASTGLEDTTGIAIPAGFGFSGIANLTVQSRLQSPEINSLVNVVDRPGFRAELLAGYRYFALDEDLTFTTDSQNVAPLPPDVFLTTDSFQTRNDFHGGQVGARALVQRGRWSLETTGKVALGNMRQSTRIRGGLLTNDFNNLGTPQLFPGGYFTLPTNIGVIPEATFQLGWQPGDSMRLFVGYTFLYVSSVARPAEQIDRVINPVQGPGFTGVPSSELIGPARPLYQGRDNDFWAQGLNFGFELRY
jgi:hypothetical protein